MIDLRLPQTFACLTRAEACRDFGTNSHERRVAAIIYRLARCLGFPSSESRRFACAGILHDIGKLALPIEVLQKPGPLSREEVALIKTHSLAGHKILATSAGDLVKLASLIALHHHEKYDGTGYPSGLMGDAIPLPAQLTSICDIYDALRSDRPYRRGMFHDDAMAVIVNGDSRTLPTQFAPRVLSAFVNISERAKRIFETPHAKHSSVA